MTKSDKHQETRLNVLNFMVKFLVNICPNLVIMLDNI